MYMYNGFIKTGTVHLRNETELFIDWYSVHGNVMS